METLLRKPILVGGAGLYMTLLLWQSIGHSLAQAGELGMLGTLALGFLFWAVPKKSRSPLQLSVPVDTKAVEEAIKASETMLNLLATEAPEKDISVLQQELAQLKPNLDRQNLKIALTGGSKVGKTSLKNLLEASAISEHLSYFETEKLLSDLANTDTAALDSTLEADLVLFVTNGDITESEWQIIQKLNNAAERVLVVLNKQDQYIPEDKSQILQHIRERVSQIIKAEDVIAASCHSVVKVRKHQEDGTVQEWTEKPTTETDELTTRVGEIVTKEKQQLLLATTWREAMKLKIKAKNCLNEVRKQRALPVIEQYQWLAGGTAFANPMAALDLVAAAAINGQMIADLSQIYQQKLNLEQAQTTATTLGKLMVKLGLVELTTGAIGSALKTHAITYVAGGALQGISAAYLTRIAGLSIVEYLEEQEVSEVAKEGFNLNQLGEKIKLIFQQNSRTEFIQGFVKQAIGRINLKNNAPQAAKA